MTALSEVVDITNAERAFLALIPEGEENAVSMKELAFMAGTDERAVRAVVLELRDKGFLICSGNSGYWKPGSDYECLSWYRMARSRAMSTLRSLKAMRKRLQAAGIETEQ